MKEIKKILELHKLWLNNENKGEKADLRGADLSRANLYGANLSRANLREADLYGAKGILRIENQYQYQCYAYYYDNEKRIKFGCCDRTLEEWENDFWNNNDEFPENSKIGQLRYINFQMFKMWFNFNDKYLEAE